MKRIYMILIMSFGIICTLLFTSCYSTKILDVPLVSMTRSITPAYKKIRLKSIGEVKGKYCITIFEFGRIGMMDSIIREIQETYKVDYIKNITVSMHGDDCMDIVGEGMRIKRIKPKQ